MEIELSQRFKNLAAAVRQLRKQAGLTQEQFADSANLSTRTIRHIEKGESNVEEETMEAISKALGVPSLVLRCMAASEDDLQKISKFIRSLNIRLPE